jgi:hypothetical protein
MRRSGYVALTLAAVAAVLAGCGGEDKRYGDAKIVDKLDLQEVEGEKDYAMRDDPFCTVDRELLNTRSEVDDALDADDDLVVASREGNVGIVGVFLAPDCRDTARKKLSRLDPEPAD